ncbi:response regulator [Cellvibrio sp.]|uniref:response regulator n=1 Tax=Cellvibrio sp. TaxID=1965322 RepID=UPI0039648AE3
MATTTFTSEQHELLSMLVDELQSLLEASLSTDDPVERLQDLVDFLENFAGAAELIGLNGLAFAWRHLRENFLALAKSDQQMTSAQRVLVDSWIIYFLEFLHAMIAGNVTEESVLPIKNFLAQPDWPRPLEPEQQAHLSQSLQTAQVVLHEQDVVRLPDRATPDMLSMVVGEDINPDLFEGLMIELPAQVAQFTDQLNEFAQAHQMQSLASAQRIAHTLKGSANVVGISGLANFMHFSEDLLEEISRHQEPLTPALKNLLLDMSDTLATMLDSLTSGERGGADMGDHELNIMQQVLDAYHAIRAEGFAGFNPQSFNAEMSSASSADVQNADSLASEHADNAAQQDVQPDAQAQASAQTPDSFATYLRIKEETAQDLLRLAGESAIATNRLQTQVTDLKNQVHQISALHNKLTQLTEEFGQLIEVRELFNTRNKHSASSELDPLELDNYNELHSFFHQLQEFAIDTRDAIYQTQGQLRGLEDLTFDQQLTNRSSQNHLLEMRMIPASHFEARFQRCVRQACRLTGKQARFQLHGGETMIDSHILHELVDPLMHLLRNAVDHGIEFSSARTQAGKPGEGKIDLYFGVQGQSILVRVVDDGVGLQLERIAQKARELAIEPPASSSADVSELWLKQIIFAAGFSTREQVSQTSGRGIGLDMVADRVNALKGRVTVNSFPDQGCEFSIRLPMPMIAEQGLLVTSGIHNLAISSRGVEQLLFLDPSDIKNRGPRLTYLFNQQEIDVFHLSQLAQLPDLHMVNVTDARALLIVEALPGQHIGVLIERVLASREMVIKPLTPFTPVISGVVGATVLGDGAIAPVLDIQQLVVNQLQAGVASAEWIMQNLSGTQQLVANRPMALIVDDSLSTRRSLAQFVGDMGMDVRTAKDGFEAIEILQQESPHILLVDMEMPRMNGLELTAHVRANESTKDIPVIMITSRNTEKHRNLAVAAGVDTYLNKPFSEEELLHHIQENMHA